APAAVTHVPARDPELAGDLDDVRRVARRRVVEDARERLGDALVGVDHEDPVGLQVRDRPVAGGLDDAGVRMARDLGAERLGDLDGPVLALHVDDEDVVGPAHAADRVRDVALLVARVDDRADRGRAALAALGAQARRPGEVAEVGAEVYGGGRVAPHVRAIDTHKPGLNLKRAGRHADAGGVEDHDFDRLLEEAEALFGAGDTTAARRSVDALAERWACQPLRLSRVLNDLGVIASMSGDADAARSHLARAVAADPANAGALENLGAVCRADGDDAQAAHWLRRAREVAPGVESIRDALVDILERTHAWEEAAALRPPPGGPSRLLILTHAFHPSVGGTEMLAEQAAVA